MTQGGRSWLTSAIWTRKNQEELTRSLLSLVLLFRLVGEAPFVTGSIAPTLQPNFRRNAHTRMCNSSVSGGM